MMPDRRMPLCTNSFASEIHTPLIYAPGGLVPINPFGTRLDRIGPARPPVGQAESDGNWAGEMNSHKTRDCKSRKIKWLQPTLASSRDLAHQVRICSIVGTTVLVANRANCAPAISPV